MLRDIASLSSRTFDLLIVGGGVYGLVMACDAAQRGLDVALIERDDFGSGSSFNHARTIHGGLRYLQHLDVRRSRESVRERRTLARIAPHAVEPLPFALPLFRSITRGRLALRAAFLIDRILAGDRNRGLVPTHHLPPGRVLSRAEAVERFPGIGRRNLTGAAVWHDYVTLEADRLTLSWALAAAAHDATLANYVEAVAPLVDGRRMVGVKAFDRSADRPLEVSARLTINAAGSGVDRLLVPLGVTSGIRFLKAMNLVTSREAGDEALGGRTAAGRHVFLVPYRHRALFGTWESPRPVEADDTGVKEADVATFIGELNAAFPSLDLTLADVTLVHRGVVPAAVRADGSAALEGHEQIRDHAVEGVDGIISVVGAKYTTARGVGERVIDRAIERLKRQAAPCRTASVALPGGDLTDTVDTVMSARREYDARVPSDTIPHLVAAYGSRYRDLLEHALQRPVWCMRVSPDSPVIAGELAWAARHEMVVTLGDAVMRRTPLGAMGYPGDSAVEHAAAIVGEILGWSNERREAEIAALRKSYAASGGVKSVF